MKLTISIIFLLLTLNSFSQPIIGGKLRSNVLKTSDMTVVMSGDELVQALKLNKNKIFINNNIDLSNYRNILLPDSTMILSYGKTVTHKKWFLGAKDSGFVFLTGGTNISILGTRFVGVSGAIRNYDKSLGFQGLIRVVHPNFYMNNCSVENFSTWGLFLQCSKNAVISETRFKNSLDSGFGYGIWIGGCGNNDYSHYIEYCEFTNCRHGIASSGHPTSWYLSNCSFYGTFTNYMLDRHNLYTFCMGGDTTLVSHNYFLTPTTAFGLEYPETSNGAVIITNNYFAVDSLKSGDICDHRWYAYNDSSVNIFDNFWEQDFLQPKIIENSNTLSVEGVFSRYEWLSEGKTYSSNSITKPLTTSVSQIRVWDEKGVPSLPNVFTKINESDSSKFIFNYKDTYSGEKNTFILQLLKNKTVLFKQDLALNNQLWNKKSIDLSEIMKGDTIRLRVYINKNLNYGLGTQVSFDNFFIKNFLVDMEKKSCAPFKIKYGFSLSNDDSPIGLGFTTDCQTGLYGLTITFSNLRKYNAGQYLELWIVK